MYEKQALTTAIVMSIFCIFLIGYIMYLSSTCNQCKEVIYPDSSYNSELQLRVINGEYEIKTNRTDWTKVK